MSWWKEVIMCTRWRWRHCEEWRTLIPFLQHPWGFFLAMKRCLDLLLWRSLLTKKALYLTILFQLCCGWTVKENIHVINCENTLLDCWLLTSIDSGAELHMSWTKCIIFNHILQKGFFFLLNSFWLYINKEWHLNQLASLKLLKLLVQPELEFDSAHVKWGVWNRPNRFIVLFCAPKNFAFIENHNNLGSLARPLTSPSTLIGD